MTTYSLWKPPKQYTNTLKMSCKMRLKRGYNTKYTKNSSNSQRPLMKHDKGVKICPLSVLIMAEKQKHDKLTKHAKIGTKEGYNGK